MCLEWPGSPGLPDACLQAERCFYSAAVGLRTSRVRFKGRAPLAKVQREKLRAAAAFGMLADNKPNNLMNNTTVTHTHCADTDTDDRNDMRKCVFLSSSSV